MKTLATTMRLILVSGSVYFWIGCFDVDDVDQAQDPNTFFPPDGGAPESDASVVHPPPPPPPDDAGTGCFVDKVCGGCMSTAVLPAEGEGDVLIVCSECGGDKCSGLSVECDVYGSQCEIDGVMGVCIACCTGVDAHLRCTPQG